MNEEKEGAPHVEAGAMKNNGLSAPLTKLTQSLLHCTNISHSQNRALTASANRISELLQIRDSFVSSPLHGFFFCDYIIPVSLKSVRQ